jgi:4-oxalocrotonate tautomerase family enzyme
MPLVRIEILKGHTADYKKMLLQSVHDALLKALGIPDDDRFQRLYEIEEEYFELSATKSDKFTLIDLTLFPGRSKEIKRNMVKEISRILEERLNIPSTDIFILINEPSIDNRGMRGEQASEMEISYKKD